jgi:hypothetical protein
MILNNTPQNEAILSNVGQVGEFRIRNSAKAFSILSSGLYANKIRAIVRELSCNAYDSHVAANKTTVPFDVHLPNLLEPWFSIRDYGTGLSREQVTNLYTTYFESTKTTSNEFIGALGLGSKSPFSYTDNFTVTAVKDGVRGIYTAFINEQGVPSIALMAESETTEPNGVEVKFSVNDTKDFGKFQQEAGVVYKHFKLRPVISGASNFKFTDPDYKERDIVPGIHRVHANLHGGKQSVAIMGNIEYPINVPDSELKGFGDLAPMLNCGLVIEFGIGQLDFQASREGLSYVGVTLASIKSRLEQLRDSLSLIITREAKKLENIWERAIYLAAMLNDPLYKASATKYIKDTGFDFVSIDGYVKLKSWELTEKLLQEEFNIVLKMGGRARHERRAYLTHPTTNYNDPTAGSRRYHTITISKDHYFVINDTKKGVFERTKYHWARKSITAYSETFCVIEKFDKTKPLKTTEFFAFISNPPKNQILLATELSEKPKKERGEKATILSLQKRNYERRRDSRWVWEDAGTLDDFDDSKTYYYVPLSHYTIGTKSTEKEIKNLYETVVQAGIQPNKLYGVRKQEWDAVSKKKNWVHLDTLVLDKLKSAGTHTAKGLAKSAVDFSEFFKHNVVQHLNSNSPFAKLFAELKDVRVVHNDYNIKQLIRWYGVEDNSKVHEAEKKVWIDKIQEVNKRYPFLSQLGYRTEVKDVIEYINMIDQVKGI